MGIKINKTVIAGCFGVTVLIILASLSPVVGFQIAKSDARTTIGEVFSSIKEKRSSVFTKVLGRESLTNRLRNVFNKNEIDDDLHNMFSSLLNGRLSIGNPVSPDPSRLLTVLILTILVEFLVYTAFVQSSLSALFFASVVINLITNPAVNFVYYNIYDNVAVLETVVIIAETFMIFALFNALSLSISLGSSALLSLIANMASYVIASGIAMLIYGPPT